MLTVLPIGKFDTKVYFRKFDKIAISLTILTLAFLFYKPVRLVRSSFTYILLNIHIAPALPILQAGQPLWMTHYIHPFLV